MTIHLDIGGEGRYANAINVNPNRFVTEDPARAIPNLVLGRGEQLPFANGIADLITVESAPLRPGAAEELARVLRPGGTIRLYHPSEYALAGVHDAVAGALGTALVERSTVEANGLVSTILRRGAALLR